MGMLAKEYRSYKIKKRINELEHELEELSRQNGANVADMMENVSEFGEKIRHRGRRAAHEFVDRAHMVRHKARENPGVTLAIVGAIGLLAGLLVVKSSKR